MNRYYAPTFAALGIVLGALTIAALLANTMAGEAKTRYAGLLHVDVNARAVRVADRDHVERLARAAAPMHDFAVAWHSVAAMSEKAAAERIRADVEAIAQRQLGLVTDNAITPQPERYVFQGGAMRVQRVTVRASGNDLAALMTWLGKVEEKYPAAAVELCEFSSNVGGSTGLTVRLVQPVGSEAAGRRFPSVSAPQDSALEPESISGVPWLQYLPSVLKLARAVGFSRNPLQPGVSDERSLKAAFRSDEDSVTPRVCEALQGRVRSVIRGPAPIVVIDGRIFRVGDELLIGASRNRPVPTAETRLKAITDDSLLLQVTGGTTEDPVQREVSYRLPAFQRAR